MAIVVKGAMPVLLILFLIVPVSTFASPLYCSDIWMESERQDNIKHMLDGGYIAYGNIVHLIQDMTLRGFQFEFVKAPKTQPSPLVQIFQPAVQTQSDENGQFITSQTKVYLPEKVDDVGSLEQIYETFRWLLRVALVFDRQQEGAIFHKDSLGFTSDVRLVGFLPKSSPQDPVLAYFARAFNNLGLREVIFAKSEMTFVNMRVPLNVPYAILYEQTVYLTHAYVFEQGQFWANIHMRFDELLYQRQQDPEAQTPPRIQ